MRFQASQFSTSTSLHHVSKIVSKCIKIVSTDVRKYKIFSGEIPRTPLTRGGQRPLSCSPPTRAFGTRERLRPFMAGPLFKSRRRPWLGMVTFADALLVFIVVFCCLQFNYLPYTSFVFFSHFFHLPLFVSCSGCESRDASMQTFSKSAIYQLRCE